MKILLLILGLVVITSLLLPISLAEESTIPDWVINIFIMWTQGEITEDSFLNAIEFLVSENIIPINQTSINNYPKTSETFHPYQNEDKSKSYNLPKTICDKTKTEFSSCDETDTASLTFFGLVPTELTDIPVYEEGKREYYFKFHYENLLTEERLLYCPWILHKVVVETDKGYFWKYKNDYYVDVPIKFCHEQMDPKGKIKSDKYGIMIKKDETPKFIYMTINDTKYTFKAEIVSLWDFKK